jgi:hypothetical protein
MEIDGLKRRLKNLPRRLRIAFTAFCVERVLPIFENVYYESEGEQPQAAVYLAWRYACGEDVSPGQVTAAEQEIGDLLKVMNESGRVVDSAKQVCMAAIYLLDAIIDSSEDESANHAFRAVGFAHEAVRYFEDYAGPGGKEELEVQEKALQLAESWGDKPIKGNMFRGLGPEPPTWLQDVP